MPINTSYFDLKNARLQTRRFCASFFAPMTVLGLAACQPDEPPALSLEEAKQATASFEGQSFTPPPKSIVDIEMLLASQPPLDPTAAKRDKAILASKLPADADENTHGQFYAERTMAAGRLGLLDQDVINIRKAYPYVEAVNDDDLRRYIRRHHAYAEYSIGNYAKSARLFEALIVGKTIIDRTVLAKIYATAGNFERTSVLLAELDEILSNAQNYRKWDRHGEAWTGSFYDAKAIFLAEQGKLTEAERFQRLAVKHRDTYRVQMRSSPVDASRSETVYGRTIDVLASILVRRGKLLEAEVILRDAIRDSLARLGRSSLRTNSHLTRFSEVLSAQGRNGDAARIAQYLLMTYPKLGFSPSASDGIRTELIAGQSLALQSRWRKAIAAFERAETGLVGKSAGLRNSFPRSPAHAIALTRVGRNSEAVGVANGLLKRELSTVGEDFVTPALVVCII